MNFSEMTDAQICQKVGEIVSRDGLSIIGANGKAFIHHYSAPVGEYGEMCLGWKEFDPCSSWADAGPIIEKQRITIAYDGEEKSDHPCAWVNVSSIDNLHAIKYQHPEKTLRAAMIVFLMMQEKPDAA